MKKNRSIISIILTVSIVLSLMFFNELGVSSVKAASKLSGLDFSMKKNVSFNIDCYTPAGMKPMEVKMLKNKKKKLTAGYIVDQEYPEDILAFYDDYYCLDYFDEYFNLMMITIMMILIMMKTTMIVIVIIMKKM